MVEVRIVQEEPTFLAFELVGDTHTLSNLIRKELWHLENTDHASYELKHPQVAHPVFRLRVSKGKARKVLFEALANIEKKNKELRSLIKKLA